MSGFRKFFWNYKDAFIGKKFVMVAPFQASIFILGIVLPVEVALSVHKGISM